jgi:HEAT repeat protein
MKNHFERLVIGLKNAQPSSLRRAREAIEESNTACAVQVLLDTVNESAGIDPDGALREMKPEKVLNGIAAQCSHPACEVAIAAMRVVGMIGYEGGIYHLLAAVVAHSNVAGFNREARRAAATDAINMLPEPSTTEQLCALLLWAHTHQSGQYDATLLEAIPPVLRGKNERTVVEALCKDLHQGDRPVPRAPFPRVSGGLHEGDRPVLLASAVALGEVGFPEAVPHLLALRKHPNWHIRSTIIEALGAIDDLRVVQPLIEALQDTNWIVRSGAIEALSRTKNARAIGPLVAMLGDRDGGQAYSIWERAADALVALDHPDVCGAVISALKSPDDRIRRSAVLVLGRLATPGALPTLCPGAHAIHPLGGETLASPEALPALCSALCDKDRWVRKDAADCLLAAMQNGALFDQPSKIVDACLQSYHAAQHDSEKIPSAALIQTFVAQYVRDIETGLLAKIAAMCDADVTVFEKWGTDDSGDAYGERQVYSLRFANAGAAARSELERRSQGRGDGHKGWLRRLRSVVARR